MEWQDISTAPKFSETCPICGEKGLMFKFDWRDKEVKLWSSKGFHVCQPKKERIEAEK